jgi:uncharacterized Zn finger protein
MISIQCPHCEIINKHKVIRDQDNEPLLLTCPSCTRKFTPTADELFATLYALEEKACSDL